MTAIIFPNINPVAFTVFGFEIMWYAIAYVVSIIIGYFIIKQINFRLDKPILSVVALDDLLFYVVLAMIIGGRLGHVLVYDFSKFLSDPIWLFKIRQGGMSFHGAIIAILFAVWFVCKRHKISTIRVLDQICLVAPIGLFFGRIANFVNGELYGTVTDVPWAVIFWFVDDQPRHPSQIYEALLEGLLLFIILNYYYWRYYDYNRCPGKVLSLFAMFYAIFRMFIEFFREPEGNLGYILNFITIGQILSLPMLIFGIILWSFSSTSKRNF